MAADPVHRPARPGRFLNDAAALRSHLQQWRAVEDSLGHVQWQERRYRGSSDAIAVPTHWQLAKPSQCIAAIRHFKVRAVQVHSDYARLSTLIAGVDRPGFQRLLVRRLVQWRDTPVDAVIAAAHMALQLEPGCAQGKPLRALAVQGNDTKFFERHASLLTAPLDERFDGEASRQGLVGAFGRTARRRPLAAHRPAGPRPAARLRKCACAPASCSPRLCPPPHPAGRKRTLPAPTAPPSAMDTIAVLGAGLNLGWLAAPWLQRAHRGLLGRPGHLGFAHARHRTRPCAALARAADGRRHVQRPPTWRGRAGARTPIRCGALTSR